MAFLLSACHDETPHQYVDMARVAEALRTSEVTLADSCAGRFPAFAQAASLTLAQVDGADPYVHALEAYFQRERQASVSLEEPALFRLLLHRYAGLCRLPSVRSLEPRLEELRSSGEGDRASRLESMLLEALGSASRGELNAEPERQMVAIEVPGDEAAPVLMLACLDCGPGDPTGGPRRVVAAVTALSAAVDSGLRLARPLRLLVCIDAAQHLGSCRSALLARDREAFAALALDGMQPLVVSWSGEGLWDLALPHQPVLSRLRPPRSGSERPVVIDLSASETHDRLPERASMRLVLPSGDLDELVGEVETMIEAIGQLRPEARYEVGVVEGAVTVSALGEPLPAWQIDQRRNALWDLAALARALRVTDPPGGSLADLFDIIARFDGDPYGARLGLHYEDPVGGPLLIAPTTAGVQGDRAVVGFHLYRPPGLARDAFVERLQEALRRLRIATGRPIVEVARTLEEPSRVAPDSEQAQMIQVAFEEVMGEPRPAPGGAPRPGLAALLPQAVSLGLPDTDADPSGERATSLLVELVWNLSVAADPEMRRRSRWR
jgi:hypothetical protein